MTRLKLLLVSSLVALLASVASAQTILTMTTLSTAVTSTSTSTVTVGSSTGITANSTVIYVADTGNSGEAMFVNAVSGTTLSVQRGYQTLGKARTHLSGALVFVGPPNAFGTIQPSGSCTRTSIMYLPDIALGVVGTGTVISDCIGGEWVNGIGTNQIAQWYRVYLPNPGATAYTSINTNGTTLVAGTTYCSEVQVPYSKYATGLAVLNGTSAATDLHIVALYDATGNLIANSALAGAVASGASTYQTYAFTTPYYVVGPAKYYACVQSNGTSATIRMLLTSVQDGVTTYSHTGSFGTLINPITVPTTFNSAVGPYFQLY